jgi:hypothetical protein
MRSREPGLGVRHSEWSGPGGRDMDHKTRGARVRERDAIESIRPNGGQGAGEMER